MITKKNPEEKQRLFAKIYTAVIVALYFALGLYFVLYDVFGKFSHGTLPGWSYRLFGVVLMLYGVVRLSRILKK